jgi:rod shape-determining protein MreD
MHIEEKVMRKFIVTFIILVLNFCLQSTWFQGVSLFGIKFNTGILFIIFFAILRGENEGAIIGFFTGLMQDIMFGKIIGFYALIGMLLGFFTAYLSKEFVKENFIVAVLFGFLGTICYEFIVYFFLIFTKGDLNIWVNILKVVLPEAVGNLLLTIPFYRLTQYIENKVKVKEIKPNNT